jgi:hypothetical protein
VVQPLPLPLLLLRGWQVNIHSIWVPLLLL